MFLIGALWLALIELIYVWTWIHQIANPIAPLQLVYFSPNMGGSPIGRSW